MRKKRHFFSYLVLLYFFLGSCDKKTLTSPITVDGAAVSTFLPKKAEEDLLALREFVPEGSPEEIYIQDVVAILEAKKREEAGDHNGALLFWSKATKIAAGDSVFGKLAFESWLKSYARQWTNSEKPDPIMLARLILKETSSGTLIPYMQTAQLMSEASLIVRVSSIFHLSDTESSSQNTNPGETAVSLVPQKKGLPSEDKLLRKTAKQYCQDPHSAGNYQWEAWVNTLEPVSLRSYWNVLIQKTCDQEEALSPSTLEDLAPKLAADPKTKAQAVEAYGFLIDLLRKRDERVKACEAYTSLVDVWVSPALRADDFDLKPEEFELRRIDELLWASRCRALVADYDQAHAMVMQAMEFVEKAFVQIPNMSKSSKAKFVGFKAESYFVLAHRIALEKKEISRASSMLQLALDLQDLPESWRERLLWSSGLYSYLEERFTEATKYWELLSSETKSLEVKSRSYFWLARTYKKMGNKQKSIQLVEQLKQEFPYSFYTVVGLEKASLSSGGGLADPEQSANQLTKKLRQSSYRLNELRNKPQIQRALFRTELFILAGLGSWAKLVSDELYTILLKTNQLTKDEGSFVYLSRLLGASHNYLKSIDITSRLAQNSSDFWGRWPGQLLIFFPRPYVDIYERKASESSLDISLLLAVSRQESSFNSQAQSPAGAVGLMQLIPPTAQTLAYELDIPTDHIRDQLTSPEFNISLGSLYLKKLHLHYQGFLPAMLAAYNAGELSVDFWLQRRPHPDPLVWVELIPYAETRLYVINSWRNMQVYSRILKN
ncbi:MAG: lytic transglycosylase domain-containing protein [Oligoflexales bacterium]|nr:lytic transglycosylase domain-containing protein [Oligoflexales bacterium]